MRTITYSAIGIILTFFSFCGPASAEMCGNTDELRRFYENAIIAKRLKDNNTSSTENMGSTKDCVDSYGNTVVRGPKDVVELPITSEFAKWVKSAVTNREEFHTDNLKEVIQFNRSRNDEKNSQFTVGCSHRTNGQNEVETVEIDLDLLILIRRFFDRVTFYLTGTNISVRHVTHDGKFKFVADGTDIFDYSKILANFENQKKTCIFPVVNAVTEVLCEVLHRTDNHKLYLAFVENYWLLVDNNSETVLDEALLYDKFLLKVLSEEVFEGPKSLTLIGHSLGGSVMQHVVLNLPDWCNPDDNLDAFEAYTFASTGLRDIKDKGEARGLKNFIIDGDPVLRFLLLRDNYQLGETAVLTPSGSKILSQPPSIDQYHRIDGIQKRICLCLQGEGTIRYVGNSTSGGHYVGSLTNAEIFSQSSQ